jgi:hypothetical protein
MSISVTFQNNGSLKKEHYLVRMVFCKSSYVNHYFYDLTVRKVINKETFKSTV